MTAEQIKLKIKEEAKSNKGGNDYIVIKDTENGGIYGTDASASAIYGGGGVLYCIPREEILDNNGYNTKQYGFTKLDKICKEIEREWSR